MEAVSLCRVLLIGARAVSKKASSAKEHSNAGHQQKEEEGHNTAVNGCKVHIAHHASTHEGKATKAEATGPKGTSFTVVAHGLFVVAVTHKVNNKAQCSTDQKANSNGPKSHDRLRGEKNSRNNGKRKCKNKFVQGTPCA